MPTYIKAFYKSCMVSKSQLLFWILIFITRVRIIGAKKSPKYAWKFALKGFKICKKYALKHILFTSNFPKYFDYK